MTDILLIDDDPIVGKRLRPLLEEQGCSVEFFADPAAAVERLHERAFDVVVTDMRMGETNGLHVLAAALEAEPTTRVIIITGYATIELAREAMTKGAYQMIAKPFKPAELHRAIGEACMEHGRSAKEGS